MSVQNRKRINPQMFSLYIAFASIAMMFAGFTSAYIVRKAQSNWRIYNIPHIFWVSTIVIVLCSITIHLALRAHKQRQVIKSRRLVLSTIILGTLFAVLQYFGFLDLYNLPQPVKVDGNPSESFLFVIWGLHLLHIIGGIIALIYVYFKSKRKNIKEYSSDGLSIAASYWHFVDILWIYLFFFILLY